MNINLISDMQKGNKVAILDGLKHKGAIYRINAIINATRFKMVDIEINNEIKKLKNDNIFLDGYIVADFAIAALDLLGLEKYNGKKTQIIDLIESKFIF